MDSSDGQWYVERVHGDLSLRMKLRSVLYSGRTRYQRVEIIETEPMGRTLVLDGKTQSAEIDEFVYHEALVHPALLTHPQPRHVFIAGGGEGATLREVLKHRTVQRAVMADLDGELVEVCKRQLPAWHAGAFDDPRTELFAGDARQALESSDSPYDAIIVDVTDPMENGPSLALFTRSFYELALRRLTPQGVLVTQAGPAALSMTGVFTPVTHTLETVAGLVYPYRVNMVSFGCDWGFAMASLGDAPTALTPAEVDRRVRERIAGNLRFYDGMTHAGIFGLPKWLREAIAAETTVLTEETQVFLA